jgi:hypothetical protein
MPYEVKILPAEPIVFVSITPPFNPLSDVPEAYTKAAQLSQTIPGTVFMLSDVSTISLSLDDMINGMAMLRGVLPKDNRYRFLAIGSAELIKFAAQAMKQAQYGNVDIRLFASLDEAVAHVHAELGKPA